MEAVQLICNNCKHFRRLDGGCDAFPNGIPDEIVLGLNKHSEPLLFQENDIVFQLDSDKNLIIKK